MGKRLLPFWHQALALGGSNGLAEVGFAGQAEFALPAFRGIQGDNVVADGQGLNIRAHFFDDGTAFVAENAGKNAFRIGTGEGERIGMANAGGDHADQHFARFGGRQRRPVRWPGADRQQKQLQHEISFVSLIIVFYSVIRSP